MLVYLEKILNDWQNGTARQHPSAFTNGVNVYSYGYHFPLIRKESEQVVWVNESKYSVTTSKQQGTVRQFLAQNGYTATDETSTTIHSSGYTFRRYTR